MKKHLFFYFMLLTICSCSSSKMHGRSSKAWSGHSGVKSANVHALNEEPGSSYEDSVKSATNANDYTLISGKCCNSDDDEIKNEEEVHSIS